MEFPPDNDSLGNHDTLSISAVVEDALNFELANGLQFKRGRDAQVLCITNGEDSSGNEGGWKRVRIDVTDDSGKATCGLLMIEEAGLTIPLFPNDLHKLELSWLGSSHNKQGT